MDLIYLFVCFSHKQVTLVCASARLIPDKPSGIGQRALDFLEKRNVKVNRFQNQECS